jgi:hypothetical protein
MAFGKKLLTNSRSKIIDNLQRNSRVFVRALVV